MRFSSCASALCLVLLASCGGGGGDSEDETLYVSLGYPGEAVELFRPVSVAPLTSGFNGHSPRCGLVSGSLPGGLSLQENCVLSGRATQAGMFFFTLRVGGTGISNSIDTSVTVEVRGPSISYAGHWGPSDSLVLGAAVNDAPVMPTWGVPTDVAVSWSFNVVGGSLPPGLSLNAATGVISGVTTTQGSYNATVQVVLTTPYGIHTLNTSSYTANVALPSFSYQNTGGTGEGSFPFQAAYLSQAFSAAPQLSGLAPAGSILGNFSLPGLALPAGLSLNPTTGEITGTPTGGVTTGQYIPVDATVTIGGSGHALQSELRVEVLYPVVAQYGFNFTGTGLH